MIIKSNIPTLVFQISGHLYEMMFLNLTCQDFPEYQAKDKGCKATCAGQSQDKMFLF